MKLRSLLFVPGDSDRKFVRGSTSGADALILDLEDAVAVAHKSAARSQVAAKLDSARQQPWRCFVRINALDTGLALADLAAVVMPGLDGIVLPKSNGAQDVQTIGHYLDALEEKAGLIANSVKILVVSTETPSAMFALGSYAPAHPRLIGLTWGAEDLASAIGAIANQEPDGDWSFPYKMARAQCLFAAAAAGVAPIDTLYADFRDGAGLAANCRLARRDGFTGRIAIHPDQVETINACFTPSDSEVAFARRLIAAFGDAPDAGTIGMDGRMYDIPHLKAAHKTVAAVADIKETDR